MSKISIIVPIYNVEKYLEKCLDSILGQAFKDFELILVDDGSPDNCGSICDRYLKLDSRIKVIHKENGGLSSARNAGLDIAVGEYIGFVDSDDWVDANMYTRLYSIAKETDADIVQCRFKKSYDEKINNIKTNTNKFELIDKFKALNNLIAYGEMHVQMVVAWNKLYRKSLFNEIRFPNGKIHEDEFTTYKLLYKSNKVALTENELYYYRQTSNSIMNAKFNKKRLDYLEALEETLSFFKKVNNEYLYNMTTIRYVDNLKKYYFKCEDLLQDNEETLRKIKNNYDEIFKEYISNSSFGVKNKLLGIFFFINPKAYKILQSLRGKQAY
ncbi:glycosyltransferase family 2 protein [Clostridium pasteurianum]|uniref:Glycosyl transferase n=1 Tax=Clostridium pasteurianum BC1 TaxID=86416 RepID=R4JYI2_CLOPA|nr:glycosyltransferase [Clostridium pasteurianum]AGK95887.1 glycosyl transferase [Clostridium pasteurianum BC1]